MPHSPAARSLGNVVNRLRSTVYGHRGTDRGGCGDSRDSRNSSSVSRVQQVVRRVATRSRAAASVAAMGTVRVRRTARVVPSRVLHSGQPARRVFGRFSLQLHVPATVWRVGGQSEKVGLGASPLLQKRHSGRQT